MPQKYNIQTPLSILLTLFMYLKGECKSTQKEKKKEHVLPTHSPFKLDNDEKLLTISYKNLNRIIALLIQNLEHLGFHALAINHNDIDTLDSLD